MDDPCPLSRGRVLLAKPGMDAHWRGLGVVARILRDAGFEVVYLGHAGADEIAGAALDEDADVVGLSTLSGNHIEATRRVLATLARLGAGDVQVVVGGAIGRADARVLTELGAHTVLGPGASSDEIVARVAAAVATRARAFLAADVATVAGSRPLPIDQGENG